MILYFTDREMNVLGQASTGLPKGMRISNDIRTEDLETGTKTLEFDLGYNDRKKAEELTKPGNYILRDAGDEKEFYTVIDAEGSLAERNVHLYSEGSGLDLINEVVGAYSATAAMSIAQYVSAFASDSGFEIGINEVSNLKRTLTWEGEATVTERLQSVATQFDAEISYSFDVQNMTVVHKYINFWKKRGNDTGKILRIGKHIKNVIIKRSVSELATALKVRGGIPSGSSAPITLRGYHYDDGDIYVDGEYLKSRSALAEWARNSGTGHIIKMWSYDATSQSELCNRSVSQLKKISKMETTYDAEVVELPNNVRIGDIVRIADEEDDQYIQARVTKLMTSASDGKPKITLGEYTTTN